MTVRTALFAVSVAVMALASAACGGKRSYRTLPDVPEGGDSAARERFIEARSRFFRDAKVTEVSPEAVREFQQIARDYEGDPVEPYALLYAGISAVRSKQYAEALPSLARVAADPGVDPAIAQRARLYTGLALVYAGRPAEARGPLEAGKQALENELEKVEWDAAMAEAAAAGGDRVTALASYDRFYAGGRPAERAYALARIRELGAALGQDELERVLERAAENGPVMAVLGDRVEGYADEARDARAALGLTAIELGGGDADPDLVGALIPLSGRRARVGEVAMRGLSLAAGAYAQGGARGVASGGLPKPFTLDAVDPASKSGSAAQMAAQLARAGAIGVIGPIDRRSVDAAGREAQRHGMPIVSLDPRASSGEGLTTVHHVMHSAEDRARALARHAIERGVRDFAILEPKSGYGRAVGDAFADELRRRGGVLVVRRTYDRNETSFGPTIRGIKKPWKALFVPDSSERLELIAPALAAANLVSQPVGAKKPRRGRSIVLLSTAEGLDDDFLRAAGRYSRGAILAPGFYADRDDPRIARFVDRFEQAFGRLPVALDAYAYDAVLALRGAVESGARSRRAVLDFFARGRTAGVTGDIAFDVARRRDDPGVMFTVAEGSAGELAIRAIRGASD